MKSILITGGSAGIGSGLVKHFSNLGYDVKFTYLKHISEALNLAKETGSKAYPCDVTKIHEIEELYAKIGGVDIIINNAGVSEIIMCTDIGEDSWDFMLNTNLKGAFLVSKTFVKDMISRKYGRIINIGSMWGLQGSSCEVHYSASKAGLIGLTKSLAKELGPSGITVNLIAPGIIDTDMNKDIDKDVLKTMIDECPVGRIGNPSDVANLAAFLASDESSYITGTVIPVDGGYTA